MCVRELDVMIGRLSAIEIELHNIASLSKKSEDKIEILELADQVGSVLKELKKQRVLESLRSKSNGII